MVVSVAPFNIIAGPADVWVAPVGETLPTIAQALAASDTPGLGNWFWLGETEGGVTVQHGQSINKLRVDQSVYPKKAIRTEMNLMVSFSLANLTLDRYAKALNDSTVTTDAGNKNVSFSLDPGVSVKTTAMVIRGPSPYGTGSSVTDWFIQYELGAVVQEGEPQVTYTRDDKAVLAVQFGVLGSSSAFGTLRARHIA